MLAAAQISEGDCITLNPCFGLWSCFILPTSWYHIKMNAIMGDCCNTCGSGSTE